MPSISLTSSGCDAKDSQTSELNHCTSQEHNGGKTGMDVSVLGVGEKLNRI